MRPRGRWLIVAVSACGLAVGQGPIGLFAASVFIKPISDDLGLGRGVLSSGIALSNMIVAIATPAFGRALDVRGVRSLLLASIVLFATATAALGTMTPTLSSVLLLYGIAGLCSVGQNPTVYSKVLASHFDRNRGLAMGLALGGVGLGTALMPTMATRLIAAFGWRMAFVSLGIAIILLAFVPVLLFMPEVQPSSSRASGPLAGASAADALRTRRFWSIAAAFFLMTVAINGTLVHVVPLLTDRGMSSVTAAATLGAAGLALLAGRVAAGFMMDRVFAPFVAVASIIGPALGIALLGWNLGSPVIATSLIGLGVGAEVDLMSFLVTRYFGLRAFGTLHGLMFSGLVLGNAVGAALLGWSFQLLHSYQPAFLGLEVVLAVSAVVFATLGPYEYPARQS